MRPAGESQNVTSLRLNVIFMEVRPDPELFEGADATGLHKQDQARGRTAKLLPRLELL